MSQNYKFNQHTKCEYFPCHKGSNKETFNCLFCYCPLFMLKDKCGGDFKVKTVLKTVQLVRNPMMKMATILSCLK